MRIDEWTLAGPRITDEEVLSRLQKTIEDASPLIIEHRFYRGARAPHRFVCDDFEDLKRYLRTSTKEGDSLYFWLFEDCCREDNKAGYGKIPDAEGRVPQGGAY
jgi:hypothetical protein